MNTATAYNYRYLAQIDIEAVTPLAISTGESDFMTDSTVTKDINGLPYIPGTSIAGVVRHIFEGDRSALIFGFQDKNGGLGSKLIFSEGKIIGKDGSPIDGLYSYGQDELSDRFVDKFKYLPIRQHVRISASGSSEKGGKFDEQVVFKGTRFRFEMELRSEDECKEDFLKILSILYHTEFRLGGSTRSGFGKLKVVSCTWKGLDLRNNADRDFYLSKSSSLVAVLKGEQYKGNPAQGKSIEYKLSLSPVDFLLIGSGIGDDEADMTPVSENFIVWDNGKPSFRKANLVIPASSLKGALAHRTAYHYNLRKKVYLDSTSSDSLKSFVGDKNDAVAALFGSSSETITRGLVLFSDIIQNSSKASSTVLNHASIDRFTGGAKDGALYQEKVIYNEGERLETSVIITNADSLDDIIIDSFESALNDLCQGLLPLGGGTNRGNGCFNGSYVKMKSV